MTRHVGAMPEHQSPGIDDKPVFSVQILADAVGLIAPKFGWWSLSIVFVLDRLSLGAYHELAMPNSLVSNMFDCYVSRYLFEVVFSRDS